MWRIASIRMVASDPSIPMSWIPDFLGHRREQLTRFGRVGTRTFRTQVRQLGSQIASCVERN